MKPYYVYLLRCEGGTLYTGITTDVSRRLAEHRAGTYKSKYTRAHRGVFMEMVWTVEGRSAASRLEYRLKKLTREQKEALIASPDRLKEYIII